MARKHSTVRRHTVARRPRRTVVPARHIRPARRIAPVLQCFGHGGPDPLQYGKLPDPDQGPRQGRPSRGASLLPRPPGRGPWALTKGPVRDPRTTPGASWCLRQQLGLQRQFAPLCPRQREGLQQRALGALAEEARPVPDGEQRAVSRRPAPSSAPLYLGWTFRVAAHCQMLRTPPAPSYAGPAGRLPPGPCAAGLNS